MAISADITPELLRQLLRYEPETGKLFWKPRPLDMFPCKRMGNTWNSRYANKEAGSIKASGYSIVILGMRTFRAHRLIWMMQYGDWPKYQIDHIDGVRDNNKLSNLRDVSQKENGRNLSLSKLNRSGFAGVYKSKTGPKGRTWRAQINVSGKIIHLGTFYTLEEAAAARKAAEAEYGFHKNHGKQKESHRNYV